MKGKGRRKLDKEKLESITNICIYHKNNHKLSIHRQTELLHLTNNELIRFLAICTLFLRNIHVLNTTQQRIKYKIIFIEWNVAKYLQILSTYFYNLNIKFSGTGLKTKLY